MKTLTVKGTLKYTVKHTERLQLFGQTKLELRNRVSVRLSYVQAHCQETSNSESLTERVVKRLTARQVAKRTESFSYYSCGALRTPSSIFGTQSSDKRRAIHTTVRGDLCVPFPFHSYAAWNLANQPANALRHWQPVNRQ